MRSEPVPDAETRPYWEGVAAGELRLQRCGGCGRAVFYPRAICPHCFGADLSWFAAAGTGTVYSYTIVHRAFGEFAGDVPFTVALVDLDEGVRLMTRIVPAGRDGGRDGEGVGEGGAVRIGDRVRVVFTSLTQDPADPRLPCFTPLPATPHATRNATPGATPDAAGQ